MSLLLISCLVDAEDIFTNEFEALMASRVNNLVLKDPHVFAEGFGCNDITGILNSSLNDQITMDGDSDNFLDISLVTQFNTDQPSYINSKPLIIDLLDALCTDPLTCTPNNPIASDIVTSHSSTDDCLAPFDSTTSGYPTAVTTTTAPCYVSEPQDATLNLNGIVIPLEAYQQGSRYQSGIALDQGLHMGFISESAAMSVVIPDGVPLVGGDTLFNLLPGGGSCSAGDDRDTGPDGETSGWWFYFNSNSDLIELD